MFKAGSVGRKVQQVSGPHGLLPTQRRRSLSRLLNRLGWLPVVVALLCLGTRPAQAEEPTRVSAAVNAPQREQLRIANRSIIELRGPIAGHTAKDRVTNTLERIERALGRSTEHQVTLEEKDYGTLVLIDNAPAFAVTRIDIQQEVGETTHLVADEARKRLERAIAEYREQHSHAYLLRAAGYAAGATVFYILLIVLLRRLTGWLGARIMRTAAGRASRLSISGVSLFDLGRLLQLVKALVFLVAWFLGASLTVAWLAFTLTQFPFSRPWGEELSQDVLNVAKNGALAVAGSIPGLLIVLLIALLARSLIRFVGWFFDRVESEKAAISWLDPESVRPTRRIFGFVIWTFALVMAYPYLPGSDTEAFKGLSVLLGLMVSLGGSSIVGQAASGLTLMYARTIRVGDYVRIGDSEGTVTEIGMVATRLRTGLGEEIVIPSATVMGSTAKNYSRSYPGTGYVVDTTVTIGYATPWRQVHAMLHEAAERTPDVARHPVPIVRQLALSDFYVEYRLAAYTAQAAPRARAQVLSELHANIQDVFNSYGVQIMSPHYRGDPPEPQVIPPEGWFLAPATGAQEPPAPPRSGAELDQQVKSGDPL